MMWLLKLPFNQNLIIINHKSNDNLRVTSFLEDTRETYNIIPKKATPILSQFAWVFTLLGSTPDISPKDMEAA
jgi:hypothetical protein